MTMSECIQIINEIENAALLCEKEYSHEDIFNILKIEDKSDIDIEKQICILKLEKINTQEEADLLVYHLTNHHGLIREAVASKLNEFMSCDKYSRYFQTEYISDSLLKAVNDINPNICRLITEILPFVVNKDYLLKKLYIRFDEIFDELEKLKRSNWFTKKLFNLYWGLEALNSLSADCDERLEDVLEKSSMFKDYTIREKTAMVLYYLASSSLKSEEIKKRLKKDSNYYVKRYSQYW